MLVGGLGLGFSLRATLDLLGPRGKVVLAEQSASVVEWNRVHVGDLAGRPLEDPRVSVRVGDVRERIREARAAYDLILLDVDNGPDALIHEANAGLYDATGIVACHASPEESAARSRSGRLGPDDRLRAPSGARRVRRLRRPGRPPPRRGRAQARGLRGGEGRPGRAGTGRRPHRRPR